TVHTPAEVPSLPSLLRADTPLLPETPSRVCREQDREDAGDEDAVEYPRTPDGEDGRPVSGECREHVGVREVEDVGAEQGTHGPARVGEPGSGTAAAGEEESGGGTCEGG